MLNLTMREIGLVHSITIPNEINILSDLFEAAITQDYISILEKSNGLDDFHPHFRAKKNLYD